MVAILLLNIYRPFLHYRRFTNFSTIHHEIEEEPNTRKISTIQNSKGFVLWRLYVIELVRRVGVSHLSRKPKPVAEFDPPEVIEQRNKADRKARPHILLDLGEEPATLAIYLLISDATTNEIFDRLCNTCQQQNI